MLEHSTTARCNNCFELSLMRDWNSAYIPLQRWEAWFMCYDEGEGRGGGGGWATDADKLTKH